MCRKTPLLPMVLSVAVLFVLGSAASPRAAQPAEQATVSFKAQVQPIFNDFCVTCHQSGGAQQGLVLEEGAAYASLVGRASQQANLALVAARMPDSSYLLRKLEGSQIAAGGKGARMPLGGELDPGSIQVIRAWIAAGAQDN